MKTVGTLSFWLGILAAATGVLVVVISLLFFPANHPWPWYLAPLGVGSILLGFGLLWVAYRVEWGSMKW
ncbi:MAG: hypothetical protein UY56_C0005G0020 [Parcubacteria group bacterium GW2011_GWA1_50_14]|uniref:Uncharacterized protein n=1 Tax=Candidatus Liptonbacteria bacterium GWB1_49_6 TaxID=1798644 RepID=A0A1G2C4D7_9BACT|nr:MAG: hypothetical protein UY56_C0005G0020 [Parcubacteria group bacterium GW2011_GWA1_50_14]OGY96312.1 MAG: hypothetical protein A2122_00735 [Candidatus Liptonbacteria bacterium GWB1_49_6]